MLIISDDGREVVRLEGVTTLSVTTLPDGSSALLAYAPGVTTRVARVGDRPEKALAAIVKGSKEGWKVVDLPDLIGAPPDLEIPRLVLPGANGG